MRIRRFPNPDTYRQMAASANVVPVAAEILADTKTPVSLLLQLAGGASPAFLLESVEGGERWGRFSFLSTETRTRIRVFKYRVTVTENGDPREIVHDGDPFTVLRELMKPYRPAVVPDLPRFWGGLVGYLTYEAVSFIEKIPNALPDDTPVAEFVIPETLLIFDNLRHTLLCVVITFPETIEAADRTYAEGIDRLEALVKRVEAPANLSKFAPAPVSGELSPLFPPEHYREMVKRTQTEIRAGEIIQAVVSQPFVCDAAPDPHTFYRAQRFINPSPYMFFFQSEDTALAGSSPETMVRLENGVASLRPIAGTRPRGKDDREDYALADELLADEKERAEHLMLVDLGRNDLGRCAVTGSVQVTELMVIERYSHVMHLVSHIVCDLKPALDAWDLLKATFPAGTLSGAPKVRAMEIIAELEKAPRGPYGGAVGYVSFDGNMDMAITIRTAVFQDGNMTVRAGAGIVADSDPERERIETQNKAEALARALRLINENR